MTHDEAQTSGQREDRQAALDRRAADYLGGRDEAWHAVGAAGEPAFQNAWANVGGALQGARFKRVGNVVFVQGHVTGGAVGTIVFTLPAGYRPAATLHAGFNSNGAQAVSVAANGDVGVMAAPGPPVPINFSFPFDQ
jgi:hypothetical protein